MHNKKKEEEKKSQVSSMQSPMAASAALSNNNSKKRKHWLFNSKGESMLRSVGNKHEPSMRQSLLLPRLTSNWLRS